MLLPMTCLKRYFSNFYKDWLSWCKIIKVIRSLLSSNSQNRVFCPYLKTCLTILRNFKNNKIFLLYRFGPAMKLVSQLHGENANLCPDKLISKCQKSTVRMEMKCHTLTVKRLKKFKWSQKWPVKSNTQLIANQLYQQNVEMYNFR